MAVSAKEQILAEIKSKGDDYGRYPFTPAQNDILKTFFDLVQKYDSLEDYYRVCVLVLQQSMSVDSRLYLTDEDDKLQLVEASDLEQSFPVPAPDDIRLSGELLQTRDSLFLPIYFGGLSTTEQPPAGVLQVIPSEPLSEQEQFFVEFFSRRIGISLGYKVTAYRNVQHIKFVNGLVSDMEHNVIIPNMYFKHLFNKLRKKISGIDDLEEEILSLQKTMGVENNEPCKMIIAKVGSLQKAFAGYHSEMQKHHDSCSLFLESLFRKDHFESGKFILRPKKCFVEHEIIDPQLEHFAQRFHHQGIVVRRPSDMRDEEIALNVDIGLLAQVYANLFSNALKYASIVEGGEPVKVVAYGREYAPDCFGEGLNGMKFNVFSTGAHIPANEASHLFDEGFRGGNAGTQSGKGHGLTFIRQVVEIHGGRVSYEAVDGGNNFCFYLPLSDD